MAHFHHTTVLLNEGAEAILGASALLASATPCVLDGTFGRGGHSRRLLEGLATHRNASLIAFDKDAAAIASAQEIATIAEQHGQRFTFCHASYADVDEVLAAHGVSALAGALLDLGISSPQVDEAARGFSFRRDGPLDMRMDQSKGETAGEFLQTASVDQLIKVLRDYGEERFAVPLAKALVARREAGPAFAGTGEFAAFVALALKQSGAKRLPGEVGQDPATRTFQALRSHVNQELAQLEVGLPKMFELLEPGGRLAVISFHSLEDRIVKHFMRDCATVAAPPKGVPVRAADLGTPRARLIGKPIRPSDAEVRANPRARSAILRVLEKSGGAV